MCAGSCVTLSDRKQQAVTLRDSTVGHGTGAERVRGQWGRGPGHRTAGEGTGLWVRGEKGSAVLRGVLCTAGGCNMLGLGS